MEEKKDKTKPPNIPPFLFALCEIFPMADVRPFLEDVNQMGQTPLHYAAKNNLYDVADFLVNKCQVNIS